MPTSVQDAATRATQRSIFFTCLLSLLVLWGTWIISAISHRPVLANRDFFKFILQTNLSGILIGLMALLSGSCLSILVLRSIQRKSLLSVSLQRKKISVRTQFLLLPFLLVGLGASLRSLTQTIQPFQSGNAAASFIACIFCGLAFLFLLEERFLSSRSEGDLASISGFPGLLRLVIVVLLLCGGFSACLSAGLLLPRWVWRLPAIITFCGLAEISCRLMAAWFAPAQTAKEAKSVVCIVAFENPQTFRPARFVELLQQHFGLDAERSWALVFLRRTFMPVSALMILLAWIGSGIIQVPQDKRGVYERLGIPVAVLSPGLHVTFPQPFGRVRLTEFGTIHALSVADAPLSVTQTDRSSAEGDPPDSANRLWDSSPDDASWLVAHHQAENRAGFEMLTANLHVLYRIRMSDQSALDALYTVSSPETLLNSLAHRCLTSFFSAETLDGVMATRREEISHVITKNLQNQLDGYHSGLEIVAVLIDAIQPPAAAAKSWRMVQAAEVRAATSVAEEQTRAEGTDALAHQNAYDATTKATSQAAQTLRQADADTARMEGDENAWKIAGNAFLLERQLMSLRAALAKASITVVDKNIPENLIDLRTPVSAFRATTDSLGMK